MDIAKYKLGESLFQDEPSEMRKEILEANALRVEQQSIRRPFTSGEKELFKHELSELSISLKKEKETAEKQIKEIKDKVKKAEEARMDRVKKLELGYEEALGYAYVFDDQERKKMVFYDRFGNVILERPMLPDERQTSHISLIASGTNG